MRSSTRFMSYGAAGTLMVIGVICSAVISGNSGPLIGVFFVGLGGTVLLLTVCLTIRPGGAADEPDVEVPHTWPSEEALSAEERRRAQSHLPAEAAHLGEHRLTGRAGDRSAAALRRRPRRPG
jgi:hypothetical protein